MIKKRGSFPCTPCPEDEQCRSERARICPRGLTVYDVPVFFGGYFLGHIQGGYIYQSQQSGVVLEDVYDAPESSAIGLLNLLRKIAKAIRNYCEFEEFRRELVDRELKLNTSREKQRLLISSLKKAEYEVADLKINNHFLFNTLNGMASMALDGGQMTLYQSIVNLSKLFHYTLQNQQTIVPLKKEMEFLRAYLQLQKLRYGENLQIDCSEGENLGEEPVPFNFLQPIVENAFTHGFVNENEKKLNVVINKVNDRLEITISNTGEHLEENTCLAINKAMQGTTSHGMSMIYNKLAANYGEDFRFQIEPGAENGACVRISIPAFLAGKGR